MKLGRTDIIPSPLNPNHVRLLGEVTYEAKGLKPEVYWIDVPRLYEPFLSTSGNPWLVCLIPLAVTLGEPLRLSSSIDRVLYENVKKLMYIWKSWYSYLHVVPIEVEIMSNQSSPEANKTCSFFSGGVDAFYTLLTHQDTSTAQDNIVVDDLIHVWGFDIPIDKSQAYSSILSSIRSIALKFNKNLISVVTNIRKTRLEHSQWGPLYNGAALGFVGLCLEKRYKNVLIASSHAYRDIHPWGSTYLTDPLFSTSNLTVINDGDCVRYEKIAYIAHSELARKSLHVCFMLGTDKNCSHCVKCCRTMINLELLGVLEQFSTFDAKLLTMDNISRIFSYDEFDRNVLRSLQVLAKEKSREDIYQAIGGSFKYTDFIEFFWKPIRYLKTRHRTRKMAEALEKMLLKNTLL